MSPAAKDGQALKNMTLFYRRLLQTGDEYDLIHDDGDLLVVNTLGNPTP